MLKEEICRTLSQKISADILKQPQRKINFTEKIISSGLIDSFSLVDLALLVEDIYKVRIDDTELNAEVFDSLDTLADLILSRKK